MKRLFRFLAIAVAAMAFVGCSDSEPTDQIGVGVENSKTDFQQTIEEFGNYEVTDVSDLLCGKVWKIWSLAAYSEDWSEVEALMYYKGENMGYDGGAYYEYIFTAEGEVIWKISGYSAMKHENHMGTWEFNPETRSLVLSMSEFETIYGEKLDYKPYTSSHLLRALNENTFIWDYKGAYNHREEYIVKE